MHCIELIFIVLNSYGRFRHLDFEVKNILHWLLFFVWNLLFLTYIKKTSWSGAFLLGLGFSYCGHGWIFEITWELLIIVGSEGIPIVLLKWISLGFFLHTTAYSANIKCQFLALELILIDFNVFNFVLVLFKLFVCLHLIV